MHAIRTIEQFGGNTMRLESSLSPKTTCEYRQCHVLANSIMWNQQVFPWLATVSSCVLAGVHAPFDSSVPFSKHVRFRHLISYSSPFQHTSTVVASPTACAASRSSKSHVSRPVERDTIRARRHTRASGFASGQTQIRKVQKKG
jgi:hypothetical protein